MTIFHPLDDRVLIRPEALPAETSGGLTVPAAYRKSAAQRAQGDGARGTVVATGPGMLMKNGDRWPMPVCAGECVLFRPEGAQKILVDGEELLVLRDDFVLAVLEPD